MSKDKEKDRDTNHQGSVVAEDDALTEWLNRLWARGEAPERIELWQVFGKYKATRGEMIHHEDFKPGDKLDVEKINKIANEVLEAAQNDADGLGKESSYVLVVVDRNRKAQPLVRRVGPLMPKRKTSLAKAGLAGIEDESEDEENGDPKSLAYRYTQENMAQTRWDKTRNDQLVGGLLTLSYHRIEKLETTVDRLMDRVMVFFDKVQESQDRALDRELIRDREKLKTEMLKDGMRTARNLLPGLFAKGRDELPANGSSGHDATPAEHQSEERTLVKNFIDDCESANISIALFGDFEEREGKAVQVTPGIFTLRQYSTLMGVYEGKLTAAALDNLMPGSGHKDMVTEQQIVEAQKAGVTDGIGLALFEIMGLRQRAKPPAASTEEEMR